jgi:segregation and condensation protein A
MGAITTTAPPDAQPLHGTSRIRVEAEWFEHLPEDLYIPPEAFAILLERFEGPLDFLLYLVRKNGFDLRHLDIAPIANQYIQYIQMMQCKDVELAADYLVMAALLADLKSRLLLPKPTKSHIDDDPRQQLLERLEVYAAIKSGATHLGARSVLERDVYSAHASVPSAPIENWIGFDVVQLQQAMLALLQRPPMAVHAITTESVSLQERIESIRQAVGGSKQPCRFDQLLNPMQGRMGIVVSLIAVLELVRQGVLMIIHDGQFIPLSVWGAEHAH